MRVNYRDFLFAHPTNTKKYDWKSATPSYMESFLLTTKNFVFLKLPEKLLYNSLETITPTSSLFCWYTWVTQWKFYFSDRTKWNEKKKCFFFLKNSRVTQRIEARAVVTQRSARGTIAKYLKSFRRGIYIFQIPLVRPQFKFCRELLFINIRDSRLINAVSGRNERYTKILA